LPNSGYVKFLRLNQKNLMIVASDENRVQLFFIHYNSIYDKLIIMAKKDSKKRLFEVMERVAPDFKPSEEQNLQELQAVAATSTATQQYGQQPDVKYADSTYKMIAPALKQINTPEKFAGAFQGWFQYLGYTPQAGNISIQRVRMDVENTLKGLGYK
jgi:hypothetical protein